MEEIVTDGIFLGELALGKIRRVDATQHEAGIVAPRDELVHRAFARLEDAGIELKLLVIKTVNDVARCPVARDIFEQAVRHERQRRLAVARRKMQIGAALLIERLRGLVKVSGVAGGLVPLRHVAERIGQAVHSRELAIEPVEAPIFLIDHNNVINLSLKLLIERFSRVIRRLAEKKDWHDGNREDDAFGPLHGIFGYFHGAISSRCGCRERPHIRQVCFNWMTV